MTGMNSSTLALIGLGTVGILSLVFKVMLSSVNHQVNMRMDQEAKDRQDWQMEQVDDSIQAMKGQQIMTNCLAVILRHLITGDHVDDLERAQVNLNEYYQEVEASQRKKAAKYNLRR